MQCWLVRLSLLLLFFLINLPVFVVVLDLNAVRDRNIEDLSGGELQRFACAVVCIQKADV